MYPRLIGAALMLLLSAAMIAKWVREDRRRERIRRERRIAKEAAAAALAKAEAACECGRPGDGESTTTCEDASDRESRAAAPDIAAEHASPTPGDDDEPRDA